MRSRTDILAIFSTFIQFTGDRFAAWVSDPRLARTMQQLLQSNQAARSENFWALHWFRLRQQHPQAIGHLWAYLQEPCYWAAERITRRFPMVQCSLADGFQIAIANVDRILKGYNPDYGSSLKAYARTAFGNYLRDQLRQSHAINISSDWGLLRRLSKTQLKQALLTGGFVRTEPYILLWQCFKAVCPPEPSKLARGLSAPSEAQLNAIIEHYNQGHPNLKSAPEVVNIGTDMGTNQLRVELAQLATIVRAYLTPAVTSLNHPQYDDSAEEQQDTLSAGDTPMTQLLASEAYTEQQQMLQRIGVILKNELLNLDAANKTLLALYYGQNLTQSEIAKQLNIQQYQVSRKLRQIRQRLLLSIIIWGQETLHIPTETAVLGNVSEVIHEWLQRHYSLEPSEVSE